MTNFITFPNLETSTHFIHIQIFAGVRIYVYWLANLIYDYAFAIVIILLLLASISLMDVLAYESVVFKRDEICTLIYLEFAVIQLMCRKLLVNMFVCNRTRNEHFACLEQAAKLNFAAVALTTAVQVKVISIFIYYHNYNISISIFAV
jgi:hypothetical protein